MIVISFVLYNLEGLSTKYRYLVSTAITAARELSLHRIDHQPNAASSETQRDDSIQTEMSRRLWWFLAATEWYVRSLVSFQDYDG